MGEKIFLSVAAPVFNEEENIEQVIKYWNEILNSAGFNSEIVVTNDGSKDKTGDILTALSNEIPRLKIITNEVNGGYGRALLSSIRNSSGKWVITIDSDGQFDLKEYKTLLDKALSEKLDGVTGFRKKKQDTIFRVFADRALNRIVRFMFNLRYKDTNCAMKLIKGELIRGLNIEAKGYPTPTEILIKLSVMGAKLDEVGINHFEREGGLSKLNPIATGISFMKFLFYLKIKINLFNNNILRAL